MHRRCRVRLDCMNERVRVEFRHLILGNRSPWIEKNWWSIPVISERSKAIHDLWNFDLHLHSTQRSQLSRNNSDIKTSCRKAHYIDDLFVHYKFGLCCKPIPLIDHIPSQLITVILNQSISERIQITRHNLIQFVNRQIDSMICESVLRKIVGPYSLRSIT